jgi:hypothetical protein
VSIAVFYAISTPRYCRRRRLPGRNPFLKSESAWFPLRNPGLFSSLQFACAILVALLRPERTAVEGFAAVERRVHIWSRSARQAVPTEAAGPRAGRRSPM